MIIDYDLDHLAWTQEQPPKVMAQQKLNRKDYTIAVKTGTDANKSKFKKEATQGEIYFATDTKKIYVAETTAGASDATIAEFAPTSTGN